MKTIFTLLILFSALTLPALADLTAADLNQIRLIIQEEIKPIKADIVTLKTDGAVVKSEVTNLKETVKSEVTNLKETVTNLKKTVNSDFDTIQKNFDRQNNIIIACIGIPLAILAIGATVWGISANRRSRKDRALETQIENLTQEIETLKQQQIIRP